MKRSLFLGTSLIISSLFTGCSDKKISSSDDNEIITVNNTATDISSNLEFARNNYIAGQKPLYVNDILVVNKEFDIPKDFTSGLSQETLDAFNLMKEEAKKDGVIINIRSGYRSFETQEMLFNNYAKSDGIEKANRYSAKPGHSEHHTGLAIDITDEHNNRVIGDWFNDTIQADWLYKNAYKYGFILRYPQNKEDITGYKFESWHYRYIGTEHSKNFAMNDLTLEEYLKIVDVDKIEKNS